MVSTVREGPRSNTSLQKPPRIVELAGPAGAGKTTLARTLSQRDEKIRVAADLELRKREHIPIFAGHAPWLLPLLLHRGRSGRGFTWDEIKAMVYLEGWPRILRQQASQRGTTLLLDHGPVFKLATLNAFGPEKLKSEGFEHWWKRMLKQWASTLDVVIWLDAPDTNLMERINTRSQRHAVKGKSAQAASQFLARYRTSYEQILAKLTAYGMLTRLQFDTSQADVEQIVDEVLVDLKLGGRGSWGP